MCQKNRRDLYEIRRFILQFLFWPMVGLLDYESGWI
jgi:hypothetical protein